MTRKMKRGANNVTESANPLHSLRNSVDGNSFELEEPNVSDARRKRMEATLVTSIFGEHDGTMLTDLSDTELRKHWCGLLHPKTSVRQWYEFMHLCILIWFLFILPYRFGFRVNLSKEAYGFDVAIDALLFLDIIVNFNCYYIHPKTHVLITDKQVIRNGYLKSWFIVDLVAVFPADQAVRLTGYLFDLDTGSTSNFMRFARLVRFARFAKIARILNARSLAQAMHVLLRPLGLTMMQLDFFFKIFFLVFTFLSVVHCLGCYWAFQGFADCVGMTGTEGNETPIYYAVVTVSTVGYGDITPKTHGEKLVCFTIIIAGAFLYAYIVGEFSSLIARLGSDMAQYESKMRSVTALTQFLELPDKIVDRIMMFYEYRFENKTLFDDDLIIEELPTSLRIELIKARFKHIISQVPFFRGASDAVIMDICIQLQQYAVMPGDRICTRGEDFNDLLILEKGEVQDVPEAVASFEDEALALMSSGNHASKMSVELRQQSEAARTYPKGSFFGEMEFLGLTDCRSVTLRAKIYCEMSSLDPDDMQELFREHPNLRVRLASYAEVKQSISKGEYVNDKELTAAIEAATLDIKDMEQDKEEEGGLQDRHTTSHVVKAYSRSHSHVTLGSLNQRLDRMESKMDAQFEQLEESMAVAINSLGESLASYYGAEGKKFGFMPVKSRKKAARQRAKELKTQYAAYKEESGTRLERAQRKLYRIEKTFT